MLFQKTFLNCLAISVFIALIPSSASGTIYYVDAEHGNDDADGLTWETAGRTITGAFARLPGPGDQIRVAEGRYGEHVVMAPAVELSGGYQYGEEEPDPEVRISVVDGQGIHRCVTGAEGATLSGFTLENGWSEEGSGVLHHAISMTVRQCVIRNCKAVAGNPKGGGGMHFYQSRSWIQDCIFDGNSVEQSPDDTASEAAGGAVMGWASEPEFYRCTFRNNSVIETPAGSIRLGGAMWFAACRPVIRECLFENNQAQTGGGAGWWNRSRPVIEDCVFRNNNAEVLGGGLCHIYNEIDQPESEVVVRNCLFEANSADSGAGIAILRNNHVIVDNCLFSQNRSRISGSAMMIADRSRCTIQHCTISDNQQSDPVENTGCIDIDATSWVTISHSIITANESNFGILLRDGGNPLNHSVDTSDVHGHYNNYSSNFVDRTGWCGNISEHPLFTYFADNSYCLSEPGTMDPMQIQLGRSPCIDQAGYSAPGYPVSYGSTRTDHVMDRLETDMGFHLQPDGIRLVLDEPHAGEGSVPQDTILQYRLLNVPTEMTASDLHSYLNAVEMNPVITPIMGGFALSLEIPGGLLPDTGYRLDVTVDTQPDVASFFYTFSTSASPPPQQPPVGGSLEVSFPMLETIFGYQDFLDVSLLIYNPWLNSVPADIHVAFLFAGDAFIFPVWDQNLHPQQLDSSPGVTDRVSILQFYVPEGIGNLGPFDFYAIATERSNFNLISPVATWSMYFAGS